MDTEHWFAPIADSSNPRSSDQYIYLSTNETNPFSVSVYNNNILIATITNLSKGSPQKYSIPRDFIITTDPSLINVKNTMGLHVVGEKKFFANIRFSVPNHAEIITSKGKSALGNHFFVGMGEQYIRSNNGSNAILNSMVSVIATEDKTNITLSNYNPDVVFSDGSTDDIKTLTLNKGESYIFETYISPSIPANLDGLIGSQIDSDKPVSITNGNFLSVSENRNNVDILMDQAVPIERIGTEYIILKGNGSANGATIDNNTIGFMEKALVIASEDNTAVYVNDETSPIVTLNKGDFYLIKDKFNNPSSGIYNLYIKATKPTYVYQLLAGTDGTDGTPEFATGGFNFIPALSCYLPSKIDEIGLVNEMPYNFNFQQYQNTKLNIITEKGAAVSVNGIPLNSSYGPFSVRGNNAWETYVVPNISGNLTVTSSKAITVGIASGNGAVGYGGYFAGFNSVPVISKGGDCDKGFTLEVDNSYDAYQWYHNGVPYTGSGANSYIINPSDSGAYYVTISKNGCGSVATPTYNFIACTLLTSKDYSIGSCNIIKIQPKFTKSTQNIVLSSIMIKTPPTNGTTTINATTGEITYTITNPNATSDKFVYYFSGDSVDFPDSEAVTVNVVIKPLIVYNGISKACVNSGIGRFYIDDVKLTDDTSTAYQYYKTYPAADTQDASQEITTLHPYLSNVGKVYVRITDSFGCYKIAEIELRDSQPNVNTNNYDSSHCDDDFDGIINVKFSDISPLIVSEYQDFTIEYYLNPNFTGTPLPNDWSYSQDTDVYVRVFSQAVCVTAKGIIHFKIGAKTPVNNISVPICDNDRNGKETVKISDYVPSNYLYYLSRAEAENFSTKTTSDNQEITTSSIFYIRTVDANSCPNIFELHFIFKQPNVSTTLKDVTICKDTSTEINAGNGFTDYKWSLPQFNGLPKATYGAGTHFVELYSNGCVYKQYFTISEAPIPEISSVDVEGNIITVNVSGGTPPYEYSLDQINWQASNIFISLSRGLKKVYVRDTYHCNPIEKQFSIINIINAITPNGDGINDILDYTDLSIYKDVKISIYDRYGNTIYKNASNSYIWDGTSNGRKVPLGTYWYIIEWKNPDSNKISQYKGWILVKNRN